MPGLLDFLTQASRLVGTRNWDWPEISLLWSKPSQDISGKGIGPRSDFSREVITQ